MDHLGSHVPGSAHPTECGDQQDQIPAGAAQEGGKYDHRHQLWQKHKNVDDTIQYPADHALSGRQCTDHTSQNQCQDAAGYADQQRLPGAVYQLRKNIISQRIGAKEMRRGWRKPWSKHLFLPVTRKRSREYGSHEEKEQQYSAKCQRDAALFHTCPPPNRTLGSIKIQITSVTTMETVIMAVVTNRMPCISG